jgi:hypothetical protein
VFPKAQILRDGEFVRGRRFDLRRRLSGGSGTWPWPLSESDMLSKLRIHKT